jgi:hypothetical protein
MSIAMKAFPLLLLLFAIAGCASPESRLRSGLIEAGLSSKQSTCMARDMEGKLSLGQLVRISSLGKLKENQVKDMSFKQFLHNVRALQDPEIVSIASSAALGCAILG